MGPNQRVGRVVLPTETLGYIISCLSKLLVASSSPWLVSPSSSLCLSLLSVSLPLYLSLIKAHVMALRAQLAKTLNLITSVNILFPYQVAFTGSRN